MKGMAIIHCRCSYSVARQPSKHFCARARRQRTRTAHPFNLQPPATNPLAARFPVMSDTIETLRAKMDAAVQALDFEEAGRCRDRINLMRGGASSDEAARADVSGLERQRPGAMGLGTNKGGVAPAPGWTLPVKPDPMVANRSRRSGKPR
ncbi:UvrB/UvrC motif-containing protein [Novosphingobium sp.]|uniref:UvrB/UvrC motif-containing protein n=1 Tax=Novosphingobium sp. TaxID=1874826 RepID=UPI003D0FD33F